MIGGFEVFESRGQEIFLWGSYSQLLEKRFLEIVHAQV